MTPELWAALAGLAAPLITALTTRWARRPQARAAVNIVAAVLLGALAALATAEVSDPVEALRGSLLAVLAAWSSYSAGWRPLGTTGAIQRRVARTP